MLGIYKIYGIETAAKYTLGQKVKGGFIRHPVENEVRES